MTIEQWLYEHSAWSVKVNGPFNENNRRTVGIVNHIRKELQEILSDPLDREEWIDVIILGLDGYLRHGGQICQVLSDLQSKLAKNKGRKWPKPVDQDTPVEHIR
jgi:hypothetical protein